MGDLSPNFSRHEFACKGCPDTEGCIGGFDDIDPRVVDLCQRIRDFFERPVTVSSGCRCPAYNAAVGGGRRSQHLYGKAADIIVKGIDAALVQEFCEQENVPGLGSYDDFTHVDVRAGYARWTG